MESNYGYNEGSEYNHLGLNSFPLNCGAVDWSEKSCGNEHND